MHYVICFSFASCIKLQFMQKYFFVSLLAICSFHFALAQKKEHRLFDQDLIIHQCNINITVKGIIATTSVEFKFYNNNDKEEEGRYNFHLNPGQAVTGLQLMLGDNYREGSIEEKWKARAAYGAIVGKRMDPALLQLIGDNSYSLNIYPIPAKGFRKVKISIEEVLNLDSIGYHYNLNFLKKDSIGNLNIRSTIKGYSYLPVIDSGLLKNFIKDILLPINSTNYTTDISYNNISNPSDINFTLPVLQKENYKKGFMQSNSGYFFAKLKTDIPDTMNIDIKKLRVYWDCSASMNDSDKPNFIHYLKLVIANYKPSQLTIVPFNQQVIVEKTFSEQEIINDNWQSFIDPMPHYGATQFGTLNFATTDDLILVFTDGKQTWGRKYPASIQTPVVFITTANYYDYNGDYDDDFTYNEYHNTFDNQIPVKTYDLYPRYYYYQYAFDYINNLATFKTKLIAAEDEYGNKIDISNRQQVYTKNIFSGRLKRNSNKLILKYGISNKVAIQQQIDFEATDTITDFNRASVLIQFEEMMKNNYWYNTLSFGIDNKILTWQTAFIVLEKVEDYVKYNITPPDDLLKECMDKGFVKHDYKRTFQQLKKADVLETLKLVSTEYNNRIMLWSDSTKKIDLNTVAADYLDIQENSKKETIQHNDKSTVTPSTYKADGSKSMDEVIVVGYSTQQRKDLTASVSIIRSKQLTDIPTIDVGEMLQGRIAGVEVIKASGEPGASSQITIRGVSSLSSNEPLFVIDGIAQPHSFGSFSPGNNISPYDIDNITVLKDAAACAIYGASASGGVILITTKTGRGYGYYNYNSHITLTNLDDIDYMQQIKSTTTFHKYETYLVLEAEQILSMGFYTDMALYFYEQGLTQYIDEMLMKAAELSNNDFQSQLIIAFIYEYMKRYDKAITIYQNLKEDYPKSLPLYRNLGWAYYQNKQFDSAISILYKGITSAIYSGNTEAIRLKDIMLADMNMIIALHPTVSIDYIPKEIIKPIEADMRVLVESPVINLYGLSIKQPWKETVNYNNPIGENKQRLQVAYNSSVAEFTIKNINHKRYSFSLPSNSYSSYSGIPTIVRIIKIRDFGKPTQSIDTDIVNLDNQYGTVEFEAFKITK